MTNFKPRSGFSSILVILAILILIAITSGISFYFGKNFISKESNPQASPINNSETAKPSETPNSKDTYLEFYELGEKVTKSIKSFKVDPGQGYGFATPDLDTHGNIFFVDRNKIIRYSLTNSDSAEIYQSEGGFVIAQISLDQAGQFLYFVEYDPDLPPTTTTIQSLYELNLGTREKRLVLKTEAVMYGLIQYLFKSTAGDVVGDFGGDGCGGYGNIYLVTNGQKRLVLETGGGCVEKPVPIGNNKEKNSVILIAHKNGENSENLTEYTLTEIFYLDVTTGKKEQILDLTKYPNKYTQVFLNKSEDTLYLLSEKDLMTYRLDNKQIGNLKFAVQALKDSNLTLVQDNNVDILYGINSISKQFNIVYPNMGEFKPVNWPTIPSSSSPQFLDRFFNSKPIFYVVKYPDR